MHVRYEFKVLRLKPDGRRTFLEKNQKVLFSDFHRRTNLVGMNSEFTLMNSD
jgi:hypothetical protein